MSNTMKEHKKCYDFPLRDMKKFSNKTQRAYGKELVSKLLKSEDVEDVEDGIACHKDAGKGDIWKWD